MNQRQHKKYIKNRYSVMIQCCPSRSICGLNCNGCTYRSALVMRKWLNQEKISISGWTLIDSPRPNQDLFYCSKKGGQYILVAYIKDMKRWILYTKKQKTQKYIKVKELGFR